MTDMFDPVAVELNAAQKRVLQLMAEAGMIGETVPEVAYYLIVRGIDDMMRDGVLKLGGDA